MRGSTPPRGRLCALALSAALFLVACNKEQARQLATVVPQLMTVVPALVSADAPAVGAPAGQAVGSIYFAGVSFTVEASQAGSVNGQTVPAVVRSEEPGFGGAAPAHLLFTFGPHTQPGILDPRAPQLRVYPVDGLRAIDPIVSTAIDDLQSILSNRPATFTADIPVFPLFNAAQVFRSQVKYLDFKNGTGARFVTAYSQDIAPISNADLFYTFQGLTRDGRFYVSFYSPVSTDVLPDTDAGAPAAGDIDAFVRNFDTYLAETVGWLDALRPQQYLPDLESFDRTLRSLTVAPPDRLPAPPAARQPRVAPGAVVSLTADKSLVVSPRGKLIAGVPGPEPSVTGVVNPAARGEPAETTTPEPGSPINPMMAPTHTLFTFGRTTWPSIASPRDPQLRVFPAAGYAAIDPAIARTIGNLKVLITSRPRLTGTLPALPMFNARQLVNAQAKYIDFANGAGVRFLTAYASSPVSVTNRNLIYTFQGITHDGQYVVTLYHPVTTTALPSGARESSAGAGEFTPGYAQYLTGTARLLNSLKPRAFTPDLALLDRLAQSLRIDAPPTTMAPAVDPGAIAPDSSDAQKWEARSAGAVNVRAAPDLKSKVIARLKLDERVYLVERNADGSWVRVRLEYGLIGWVDSRLLKSNVAFATLPLAAP